MERLTTRSSGPLPVLVRGKAFGPAYFMSEQDYEDYRDALNKLAAYEDTGLEPDSIEEAKEAVEEPVRNADKFKWISVEERLPEHGQEVLCACRAGIYEVFKYVDGISGPWYKDSRHVYMKGFVTHWMPLPEPPAKEES